MTADPIKIGDWVRKLPPAGGRSYASPPCIVYQAFGVAGKAISFRCARRKCGRDGKWSLVTFWTEPERLVKCDPPKDPAFRMLTEDEAKEKP